MKFFRYILFFLLSLLTVLPGKGYRILCVFPYNGKSHFILMEALGKVLAERGHQIDMISHFPLKSPVANYTDIINLQMTKKDIVNSLTVNAAIKMKNIITYTIATTYGDEYCNLLGNKKMQEFIKKPPNDPPYDLVIVEFFGASCYFAFGRLLNIPVVTLTTTLDYPFMGETLANSPSSSSFSGVLMKSSTLKSFWQRLSNTVENLLQPRIFDYFETPQTNSIKKYFGENMPSVKEVRNDIALMFVNAHYTFHGIRSLNPSLVEIGGLHVEVDRSQLSTELQKWMDNAKDGVVYFTLGSIVPIETLPKETILGLYASMRKIAPVKVLMKIANADKLPPNLPGNVLTSSWFPQIAILRHKNTRAFISHCGMMGSIEAFYFGIPVIGIPLFADQYRNINSFVNKGIGVELNNDNISEETMTAALNAVLNDPSYMEAAKREAIRFKDRPLSIQETSIYWTEYIIRNGAHSLRSPAMDLSWWQNNLFDVYGFLIACVVIAIYSFVLVIRFTKKIFLNSKSTETNSKLKRN